MGPKYKFTGEVKKVDGQKFYRIQRISDSVLGGWIANEQNLSQEGNCWVGDNATVGGTARVYDNAQVLDDAQVYGEAQIYGNALVYNNARISEHARVYDNAVVYDEAKVYGIARVFGNAQIYGGAQIFDEAMVNDDAKVHYMGRVYENAHVYGNADIGNHSKIFGEMCICDVDELKPRLMLQEFVSRIYDFTNLQVSLHYSTIEDYFNAGFNEDSFIFISTVEHDNETLIRIEKVKTNKFDSYKVKYKFVSDIVDDDYNELFSTEAIINTQEDLEKYLQDMEDALRNYPQYNKCIEELKRGLKGE